MAALSLDYVFTPSAGQTYSFTVLGETPGTVDYNETITLDVPVNTMNTVLTYASQWEYPPGSSGSSGAFVGPPVALLLQTSLGSYFDSLTMGLTGATSGTSYAYDPQTDRVIGDTGSSCNTLIYQFQQIPNFSFSIPGVTLNSDLLASIPKEAIQGFTVTDITTAPLSGVVGDPYVIPGESIYPSAGISGAIQSLFEQAVNYGMVSSTPTTNYEDTAVIGAGGQSLGLLLGSAPVNSVQWEVDQTLAIYVQFQLQKIRTYSIDQLISSADRGASVSSALVFGGITLNQEGLSESSEPVPITYRILLRTVANGASDLVVAPIQNE